MRIQRRTIKKARIEIIPMIDTIFFLLVFFMISTLSMTQFKGMPVNLPKAAAGQQAPAESAAPAGSPVKTVIHEFKPAAASNGAKPATVDFVSENDVRAAFEKGEKIYVTAKTIITPAARDLGDEKEIFAVVK